MNKNYSVKTTSGRSMIEIIAVLAIMAVLSIGAIAGLRYALDKIKANRIMKEALTQAVEIKGRKAQKDSNEVKYAYAKNARYVTLRSYETDPNATDPSKKKLLVLKAPNISKGVCRKLVVHDNQKMYNPIFISILTADKSTTCLNSNTIVFTVGDIPVEADPFECHLTAADCPNGNFSKKSCSCICDAPFVAGSDGRCQCPITAPKGYDPATCLCKADQDLCKGRCYSKCLATTAEGALTGLTGNRNPSTCACEPTPESEEKGLCSKGLLYIDNTCQNFTCRGGVTGESNFDCYIIDDDGNETWCGSGCTEDAANCQKGGICRDNECKQLVGNGAKLMKIDNYYGCVDANRHACSLPGGQPSRSEGWNCVSGTVSAEGAVSNLDKCCAAKPDSGLFQCYLGDCWENICRFTDAPEGVSAAFTEVYPTLFGCAISDSSDSATYDGIKCYRTEGVSQSSRPWTCFNKFGIKCGENCTSPFDNCGTCTQAACPSASLKPAGDIFASITAYSGGKGCLGMPHSGSYPVYCSGSTCSYVQDGLVSSTPCGTNCAMLDNGVKAYFAACSSGMCYDTCPSGTTFKPLPGDERGGACVKNGVGCTKYGEYWNCFLWNETTQSLDAECGRLCTGIGSGCQTAVYPQCNDDYCVLNAPIYGACKQDNCVSGTGYGWCCGAEQAYNEDAQKCTPKCPSNQCNSAGKCIAGAFISADSKGYCTCAEANKCVNDDGQCVAIGPDQANLNGKCACINNSVLVNGECIPCMNGMEPQNGRCVCAGDTYFDATVTACTNACPSGTHADPKTKQCVTMCPNGYYAYQASDSVSSKCVRECPAGYTPNTATRSCIAVQ